MAGLGRAVPSLLPLLRTSLSGPSTSLQQSFQRALSGGYSQVAEHEKGKTRFSGYYAGGFYINNMQVPGSVIAQADLYLHWRPRRLEEVTVESLAFLELINPAPQVVVFGTGATAQPLPKPVADYLKQRGVQAEVLSSTKATGYFNVLNDEGRIVIGALLAPDPDVPLKQIVPEQPLPLHERPFLQS